MRQYLELLHDILENGVSKGDRTGTGTLSVFGRSMRFDLQEGFPLLTTKRVHFRSIAEELFFFMGGHTNTLWLEDRGVTIWREWGDDHGNLGPVYSHQWRNFGGKHNNRPQPPPKLSGFEPTFLAVASQGQYIKGDGTETDDLLLQTWRGMLTRCYNKDKDGFEYYGGKGVYVCDRWLIFDNFLVDVKHLSGWLEKVNSWSDFSLDKDSIGDGFCYSADTTCWVSRSDNLLEAKGRYVYTVQHENGEVAKFLNPKLFHTSRQLHQGNFCSMLRGVRPKAQGWSLVGKTDTWAGLDQLQIVLDTLKQNPNDRRMVVSAWNPSDLPHMALPPCHLLFQFYTANGRLSCQVYQRSCDTFLGVPFNIASYALLIHLMASMAGLEPGELIWVGGDVHIYSDHMEQVELQLSRSPRALPKLTVDSPGELSDWTWKDITLTDYNPHPRIQARVSV